MTAPTADVRRVAVGIGQLEVSKSGKDVLVAYGLGSCIGVSVFDPGTGVAGLVHILLPGSDGKPRDPREPARFADYGLDLLVSSMVAAGGLKRRFVVKIAGGAAVLGPANAEKFKIGERNAEAIRDRLKLHGLTPAARDIGGTKGRTVELHVATGKTYVRTAASTPNEL